MKFNVKGCLLNSIKILAIDEKFVHITFSQSVNVGNMLVLKIPIARFLPHDNISWYINVVYIFIIILYSYTMS